MFVGLFKLLVRREKIPYTFAMIFPGSFFAILSVTFGGIILLHLVDFETTETGWIFIISLSSLMTFVVSRTLIRSGALRFFRINQGERREFKILNDNIIGGHVRSDVSDSTLLQIYDSLIQLDKRMLKMHLSDILVVVPNLVLIELIASGFQLVNAFAIASMGVIIAIMDIICDIPLWELSIYPTRKECKTFLARRKIQFKDTHYMSLKAKSKFFIILMAVILASILAFVNNLDLTFAVFSFIILAITILLSDMVFQSFYKAFAEVEESANELARGKTALFFSGSSDEEILDLTKSLSVSANEIYSTRKELEDRIAELEEYMSVSSHDLQQPLATIQAYTRLLKASELGEEALEKTNVIESQANFMRELLNDLLDYSRAKKKMPLVELKLREILEEVRGQLSIKIQEKDAKVTFKNIPNTITGQEKAISRLFWNLISNALKYSNPGKKPVIEVGCEETENNYLFHVKDNGRGIEKQFHEKIFQPFWKLGKEPGTGMGLAICKIIVENHGGKIWVESTPGKGSAFKFNIPKKQ